MSAPIRTAAEMQEAAIAALCIEAGEVSMRGEQFTLDDAVSAVAALPIAPAVGREGLVEIAQSVANDAAESPDEYCSGTMARAVIAALEAAGALK